MIKQNLITVLYFSVIKNYTRMLCSKVKLIEGISKLLKQYIILPKIKEGCQKNIDNPLSKIILSQKFTLKFNF